MPRLNDRQLYQLEWFTHNTFAGIRNFLHGREAAAKPLEAQFIQNLVIDLLDAQRHDPNFRHAEVLGFYAFCQPRLRDSFAQILQDLWVLYMLDSKRDGYFVEFGACDGHLLSNTRLLEQSYGWRGLLAEPNPVWHDALRKNRHVRISTDCVAARSRETVDFISTDKMPELSRMAAIVPDDVHERNGNRDQQTLYRVNTISLNDLLETHQAPNLIDYLSIDTEGSEYEILKNTDFTRYRFKLITVEHAGETEKRDLIFSLLESHGYKRHLTGMSRWDDWYVRQD